MARKYPEAEWRGDGRTYGPLPDAGHGFDELRLVYHTTETEGVPGYNGGAFAPHYTYDAPRYRWIGHAELNRRVGTLISSRTTGVHGNEISVQVEIVCYSDKRIADGSSRRLWVGDFDDRHYQDLGDFAGWCRDSMTASGGIELDQAYGPAKDFRQFRYGTHAEERMGTRRWLNFRGLTGHGAVPGNSHWDTGVLDLHRIVELSKGNIMTTTPMMEWRKLYNQAEPAVENSVVEFVQSFLRREGLYSGDIDGKRGGRTDISWVAWEHRVGATDPNVTAGKRTWSAMLSKLYEPCPDVTPPPPPPGPSEREKELETAMDEIELIVDQTG